MTVKPSLGSTLSSTPKEEALISVQKQEAVAKVMEERRKERMKALTRHLEVCDLLDMRNPQSVSEYAPAIYRLLHTEETRHLYGDSFMKNQTEITEKMRAYLIDWVAELHMKFKLVPETLFVTVTIIDKYLQRRSN